MINRFRAMGRKRAFKMAIYRARIQAKKEGLPIPPLPPSSHRYMKKRGMFFGRGQHEEDARKAS
jgi:hypothetical protein